MVFCESSQVGPATLLVAGPRSCGETLVLGYETGGGMEGAVISAVKAGDFMVISLVMVDFMDFMVDFMVICQYANLKHDKHAQCRVFF